MSKILISFLIMIRICVFLGAADHHDIDFVYNGFHGGSVTNLTINGEAEITQNGLLRLTNTSDQNQVGHAFFQTPVIIPPKNNPNGGNGTVASFSTTFVVAIVPKDNPGSSGNGMAFVVSPSKDLIKGAQPSQYLGLFNMSNNGDPSNNITAVEFDTISSPEFEDINEDHVGIDINGLRSVVSEPTAYFGNQMSLKGGYPLQVWVDYSGERRTLDVTVSTLGRGERPGGPFLSTTVDLSTVTADSLYVGFSASTGTYLTSHYVLGWSFKTNGQARPLDASKLPILPSPEKESKTHLLQLVIAAAVAVAFLIVVLIIATVVFKARRKNFSEVVLQEWERQIGAHRIAYKDLYAATKGFRESQVIGAGGFGKVYKGVFPVSKIRVAVKKLVVTSSSVSEQGTKQFLAEVTSIGRIRHPNLVQLLGYCRRRGGGELLLVYEYMQNSSLDKFLFGQYPSPTLDWARRLGIVKQIASGLFYLHERWTHTVLHRDIKASNVLLDGDYNARLGDFGLSKLYEHGSDPHTTRLVGTFGYMAPELNRTGRATKSTDVYAFGIFMLEVVCGRKPIDPRAVPTERIILVDWVAERLRSGRILDVVDRKLGRNFEPEEKEEMELLLRLGLLCLNATAEERPSMEKVTLFLDGVLSPLPEVPLNSLDININTARCTNGSENLLTSAPPLESVSILVGGR